LAYFIIRTDLDDFILILCLSEKNIISNKDGRVTFKYIIKKWLLNGLRKSEKVARFSQSLSMPWFGYFILSITFISLSR